MANEFLMMAEQLSAGFEQARKISIASLLKRMAKEEYDHQIQMRWVAGRRLEKEAKAKAKWDKEIKRKRRRRWLGVDTALQDRGRIKSTASAPEPPETLEAAERLTQEAMAAVMRGDKCPDRADKKREFEDAERRYGHALRLYEKLTGKDTMDTAIALNRLGWHLKVRGKYSAADTLYRRSLAIREKHKGPRSMEVLVALSNLAENCRHLKKHTESDCIMARGAFCGRPTTKPAAPTAHRPGSGWRVSRTALEGLRDCAGARPAGRPGRMAAGGAAGGDVYYSCVFRCLLASRPYAYASGSLQVILSLKTRFDIGTTIDARVAPHQTRWPKATTRRAARPKFFEDHKRATRRSQTSPSSATTLPTARRQ